MAITILNILDLILMGILLILAVFNSRLNFRSLIRVGILLSIIFLLIDIFFFYSNVTTHFSKLLTILLLFILPLLIVIFSATEFRDEYINVLKKYFGYIACYTLIAGGFVFLILHQNQELFYIKLQNNEKLISFTTIGKYFLMFLFINFSVSLVNFHSIFKITRYHRRALANWILIISFSGLIFYIIYFLSFGLLYSQLPMSLLHIGLILLQIVSFTTIFLLLKNKLRSENIHIRREVFYSTGIFIYLGIYLIFMAFISNLLHVFQITLNTFFSFLLGAGIILGFFLILFSPHIKFHVKNVVDKYIYRGKIDYQQIWHEFSDKIGAIFDFEELLTEIGLIIGSKLRIKEVKFLLVNQEDEKLLTLVPSNSTQLDESPQYIMNGRIQGWFFNYQSPFYLNEVEYTKEEEHFFNSLKTIYGTREGVLISPLLNKKTLQGLIVCHISNSYRLSYEETNLLEIISKETAIIIENFRLQQNLLESRELEFFHRVSTFFIHDIKNIMSRFSVLSENAKENIQNPEFQYDLIRSLEDSVVRIKKMLHKLRFSIAQDQLEVLPCSVENLIENTIKELRIDQRKNIVIHREYCRPDYVVLIDRDKMQQVFTNLFINAMEAMPSGGILTIGTRLEGDFLTIVVQDTGVGMSQSFVREKLFKPFMSTKENGLGVGLYQSREIIAAHDGKIFVESKPQKGASFFISIPKSRILSDTIREKEELQCQS